MKKCDFCEKDISILSHIVVKNAKEPTPMYTIIYADNYTGLGHDVDFCGITCLTGWLTKRAADASPASPLKNKRQVAKRR